MKYAVIIADGGGDKPLPQLDGRTPFEAAHTPHMDAVARMGRLGTARTTPEGWAAGSDVCTMCLLGYDPRVYHTGRAPLEAAALGINTGPQDWIFRTNLVTVGAEGTPDAGLMLDHSAGAIDEAEARPIAAGLFEYWKKKEPELCRTLALHHGVSYRNILVDSSGRSYQGMTSTPPHEIPRQPWAKWIPHVSGANAASADVLARLMELSLEYLPTDPVNKARIAAGKRPANMAWIWGHGTRPAMPSFQDRFGLRGAMITAVDLLAGIANLIGWDRLDVPGVTSYHDTSYINQGRYSVDALDDYDIVCCHIESPDEASHQGDWKTKLAAIEAIDEHVVGPILQKLQTFGDAAADPRAQGWRMLILPDHYTLVSTRKHDDTPVPIAMAGSFVHAHRTGAYCERDAHEADLHIEHGHDLMEFFLSGGRPAVRAAR